MDKCLNNFLKAMDDIRALLDLSSTDTGKERALVIFRSAIVLMVASWEQYIEQLAESSVSILTARLRDASPMPEDVKQSVALFSVKEHRGNAREFSKSVWLFSDKGWKEAYAQYCQASTSELNTASPAKLKELYKNILGIRDVTSAWVFDILSSNECSVRLDDLVNLRHDIAHGANSRSHELSEGYIRNQVEFITKIAQDTYQTIFDHTAALSCTQAITYSLAPSCYREIIALAVQKRDGILTLDEIKSLGESAQGNHNKLCYEPWALLEVIDQNTRRMTDRLFQFSNGELRLPLKILVFDNNDAIPAPDAQHVLISELHKPKK